MSKPAPWVHKTRFDALQADDDNEEEQGKDEGRPKIINEKDSEKTISKKEMPRVAKKQWQKTRILNPLMRSDDVCRECGPTTLGMKPLYALKPKFQGYKPIQLVVDSAAVDCVMSKTVMDGLRSNPEEPLKQGSAAKAGVSYVAADGGEIPNEGEQEVEMLTKEKHECNMTWQIADIQKPLLSVRALTKTGHQVNFRKHDGEIVNMATGKKIHFVRRGDLYVVTMWMRAKNINESGFRRRGSK